MDNPQIGDRVECLISTNWVKEKATGSVVKEGAVTSLVHWDNTSMLIKHCDDQSWWIYNDKINLIKPLAKHSLLKRAINLFKRK